VRALSQASRAAGICVVVSREDAPPGDAWKCMLKGAALSGDSQNVGWHHGSGGGHK